MPSLCANCGLRPYVSHVTLDTEPVALCAECLDEISGILEDDAYEEAVRIARDLP
jgi:hypothetical protein